ncbi:MAG TPA: hypothetical protein VFM15_03905 [Gammaproteobacteria bacterium]|nr:hypothetical protein [Gammaproteobacteria bacterium]
MPFTLALPDLIRLEADAPRMPALETLLTRAGRRPVAEGFTGVLKQVFRLPAGDLPVAALTRLADGGARDGDYWLRADPVQLAADRDDLLMLPLADLQPALAEAQALAASFNALYAADGLRLETTQPARWYLRTPQAFACVTHAPAHVAGKPVFDFMPSGPDAQGLRQIMNEMQMLLHGHPVNLAREATGRPPINSLWLWGGGRLPEAVADGPAWVMTDMPLVRGLALFSGAPCHDWPASADSLPREPNGMFALEADTPAKCRDIETRVARVLLQALRHGVLPALNVYPGGAFLYTVTRARLRRFWRRRRSLARILAAT